LVGCLVGVAIATATDLPGETKKADAAEHSKVFDHVGVLFNEPAGQAGLPFV
jgi:hypothetical protein